MRSHCEQRGTSVLGQARRVDDDGHRPDPCRTWLDTELGGDPQPSRLQPMSMEVTLRVVRDTRGKARYEKLGGSRAGVVSPFVARLIHLELMASDRHPEAVITQMVDDDRSHDVT